MASQLTPTPQWHDTLTIIETTDPVEGGQNGIDNKPHIELAQNIAFVKKELDELNIPADQSAAVTTIKQDLQTEISQRKQADTALNNRIDSLPAQVDYSAQITALQKQIDILKNNGTGNVGSGILVSTLEVYYYRDGDIIVPNETKILEKTGLVIQHQEVVSMPTSLITPEQRVAYITFTLPAEYDSSKHRLVVRTDNGSYTIDNQNKKIVFKVIVSTYHRDNASASTETKFAATLRVEIYNL